MVAAINQQTQEAICCPVTKEIGIYERLENIISKSRSKFNTPKTAHTHKKLHQKTIAQQVKEYQDKAISQSLLIFGTIH